MKIVRYFVVLACLFVSDAYAYDMTDTGFVYPVGGNIVSDNGWWLSKDADYFSGLYHIGTDMRAPLKKEVRVIADGKIFEFSQNGWTDCQKYDAIQKKCIAEYQDVDRKNVGIVVEHFLDDGRPFYALYGHLLKATAKLSGDVSAGDVIGYVGPWEYGDHVHFGIVPPGKDFPGNRWGRMPISSWTNPCESNPNCTNHFVNPIAFLNNNHPATLISRGKQNLHSVGQYLFIGTSDACPDASEWYRVTDSTRSDYWITVGTSQQEACQGITDTVAQTLQTVQDNGVVKVDQVPAGKIDKIRSVIASWISKVSSLFQWALPTQAAEIPVQQMLTVNRTGEMYSIAGTNRNVIILTDGSGMHGDKAIDTSGSSEPASVGVASGVGSASGKRPDIKITDQWFARSSGNRHDDVAWSSTLCPTVVVKNGGNADAPKDVKVSFRLSKGYNRDRDARPIGYEMVGKSKLQKGEKKEISHCIGYGSGDYPAYPGRFSFFAIANSDNAFAESNSGNNLSNDYSFVIIENAQLGVSMQFSNPNPAPGEAVSVAVTLTNTGTPFNADYAYTQYRIQGAQYGQDPVILEIDQTRRDHLRTNDTANEAFVFTAPTTPGIYTVTAEADYPNQVTQGDRSASVFAVTFTIPETAGQ